MGRLCLPGHAVGIHRRQSRQGGRHHCDARRNWRWRGELLHGRPRHTSNCGRVRRLWPRPIDVPGGGPSEARRSTQSVHE